ncbi:MAG: hypothetical protein JXR07_04850 [Reichenbachiella sp.]
MRRISKIDKISVISFITCLFISTQLYGQSSDVGSKIQEIEERSGSRAERDSLLIKLAYQYHHSHAEKMKTVGEAMVSFAFKEDNKALLAQGYEIIGSSMVYTDFTTSIKNLLQAQRLYEELNATESLLPVYSSLALVYQSMNEKENAIESINKAAEMAEQNGDSSFLSTIYTNKSSIYYHFKVIDSALHYGKIALAYKKALKLRRGEKLMLLNLGLIMAEYEELLDQSLAYMSEAERLSKDDKDGIMLSDVLANKIYVHYQRKELKACYAYIDSAVVALDSVSNDYTLQAVHRMAHEIYGEFEIMDKAYEHLLKENEIEEKLRGIEVQKKFEVLELNFENEKGLRQIAVLEREATETKFNYTVAIFISVFLAMLIILVYWITKRNAQLREKGLRMELDHKNRELTSYAINFVQKNTLFSELKEMFTELQKKMTPESGASIRKIKGIIDDNYRADKEWENFKIRFEEVHVDFFNNLANKFPDLGNAEVKLCALLRLNLNLKESSNVLGISPDSVKTARHRLRKKLGLNTEDNLVHFLSSVV